MKWTVLTSEYLNNDRWCKVRKETCMTPQGKIIDPYYIYDFPNWVAALALREDGMVIMTRQYRHAMGETCIELPGGCVDDTDKNFEEAIARELREETGHSFTNYQYLGKISANTSTNSNWLHMFLATGGRQTGLQDLDENEEIEIVILSLDELKQLVREHAIPQSMHITCILYGLEKLKEIQY